MQSAISKIKEEVARLSTSQKSQRSSDSKKVDFMSNEPKVIYTSNPPSPKNEAISEAGFGEVKELPSSQDTNPFLEPPALGLQRVMSVEVNRVPPLKLDRVFSKDGRRSATPRQNPKYVEYLQKPVPENLKSYLDVSPTRTLNGPWRESTNKTAEPHTFGAPVLLDRSAIGANDILASSFQPVTAMMEMHDVYIFLHRAVIRSHLKNFPDQSQAQKLAFLSLKQLKKEFEVLTEEMSDPEGYYSKWLDICLDSMLAQFDKETTVSDACPDPSSMLSNAIKRLFTSIKLLAAAISKSVFQVLRICKVLEGTELAGVAPEERYLVPLFDQLFNKKTFDKNTLKRSVVSKEITGKKFPLKDMYTKALIADNQEVIEKFQTMRKRFDPELDPFLRLDAQSVDYVRQISRGEASSEYISAVKEILGSGHSERQKQECVRTPYSKATKRLQEIFINDSPFDKAVTVLNAVKCIELDIADFYASHNLEVVTTLTADELFPVLLHLLKGISSPHILVELQLVDSFLPQDLRMSLVGYQTQQFLIGYHVIANS